jgi:DNA-directed RNA polymerase subunit RPC12/RpoP
MTDLIKILNNPEEHYPGNFDTPQRANALLTGLCQDAANEIERLNAEVLEQCRINGMSAEREDALRAELTRLKASITLDKMAENARELGLSYDPAPVQEPVASYCCHSCFKLDGGFMLDRMILCPECGNKRCPKASDHQLDCTGSNEPNQPGSVYTAPQPVPVKTYSGGKPWPVAPKPWVGLSEEEVEAYDDWADFQVGCGRQTLFDMVRDIEAKLKEKNT